MKNFEEGISFFVNVKDEAETEGHHPDLHLESYRYLNIQLYTHAIAGLSENDFILASKIDKIYEDQIVRKINKNVSDNRIPTLHLMCGKISSGKSTTTALLKAQYNAVTFSADAYLLQLFGKDFPVEHFQEHGDDIKAVIWAAAEQILDNGVDVVLDFSFWSKEERQLWRRKGEAANARVQLYYTTASDKVLRTRLEKRNNKPRLDENEIYVSLETFDSWLPFFEVPDADEHAIVIDTHNINDEESCDGE